MAVDVYVPVGGVVVAGESRWVRDVGQEQVATVGGRHGACAFGLWGGKDLERRHDVLRTEGGLGIVDGLGVHDHKVRFRTLSGPRITVISLHIRRCCRAVRGSARANRSTTTLWKPF